ncbi:MAG: hypothetical protein M1813_006884 [Trichoglossum hirsutum]|nr:MAG: hypothetical protein M1813_006884 [Trichoglossum hirsutum]
MSHFLSVDSVPHHIYPSGVVYEGYDFRSQRTGTHTKPQVRRIQNAFGTSPTDRTYNILPREWGGGRVAHVLSLIDTPRRAVIEDLIAEKNLLDQHRHWRIIFVKSGEEIQTHQNPITYTQVAIKGTPYSSGGSHLRSRSTSHIPMRDNLMRPISRPHSTSDLVFKRPRKSSSAEDDIEPRSSIIWNVPTIMEADQLPENEATEYTIKEPELEVKPEIDEESGSPVEPLDLQQRTSDITRRVSITLMRDAAVDEKPIGYSIDSANLPFLNPLVASTVETSKHRNSTLRVESPQGLLQPSTRPFITGPRLLRRQRSSLLNLRKIGGTAKKGEPTTSQTRIASPSILDQGGTWLGEAAIISIPTKAPQDETIGSHTNTTPHPTSTQVSTKTAIVQKLRKPDVNASFLTQSSLSLSSVSSDTFVRTIKIYIPSEEDWDIAQACLDTGCPTNWISKSYVIERLHMTISPLPEDKIFHAINGTEFRSEGVVKVRWQSPSGRKTYSTSFLVYGGEHQPFDVLIGSKFIFKEGLLTAESNPAWPAVSARKPTKAQKALREESKRRLEEERREMAERRQELENIEDVRIGYPKGSEETEDT